MGCIFVPQNPNVRGDKREPGIQRVAALWENFKLSLKMVISVPFLHYKLKSKDVVVP